MIQKLFAYLCSWMVSFWLGFTLRGLTYGYLDKIYGYLDKSEIFCCFKNKSLGYYYYFLQLLCLFEDWPLEKGVYLDIFEKEPPLLPILFGLIHATVCWNYSVTDWICPDEWNVEDKEVSWGETSPLVFCSCPVKNNWLFLWDGERHNQWDKTRQLTL